MSLTIKQERFVQAYLRTGNASEAYREAYNSEKMKPETINVKACYLLKKDNIRARVESEKKAAYERNKVTLDEAINILSDMVRADLKDAYNEDGTLKSVTEMPKPLRMALAGVKSTDIFIDGQKLGENKEIKLANRYTGIEMLMKHFGGFLHDNEQKQNNIIVFRIPENGR